MSTCNLSGCGKPSSPLFSHISGATYHRYDFCSEQHQQVFLQMTEPPKGLLPVDRPVGTESELAALSPIQPEGGTSCRSQRRY